MELLSNNNSFLYNIADSLYKEGLSLSIVNGGAFGYLGALLLTYIVEHFGKLNGEF
jgi:hypothetical protein